VLGAGGVRNDRFQINNAIGTAGPDPDENDQVSGWSLVTAGDFGWAATAAAPVTIGLQTLANPTTEGDDVAGPMANFDPTQAYSWAAVHWTGAYTGPTSAADLTASTTFDTAAFGNTFTGTFGWSLDLASKTLYLTYTPPA
jgi:hypothetical protein